MLIEGIDDSVLFLVTFVTIATMSAVFSLIKNSILSTTQVNPTIHTDAVTEINTLRRDANLTPSAPPSPDEDSPRRRPNFNMSCPICLGDCFLPIETVCGHIFCGNCIIQYWNHAHVNIYSKMKCPMCRQEVSVLLPLYSRDEQERYSQEYRSTFDSIKMYNIRFSGEPRPWLSYLTDIPIIFRHVLNELLSMNSLDLWQRLRFIFLIVFGLFYLLLPLDLVPEVVFGFFGLIDDILVGVLILIYVCYIFRAIITNSR